MLTWAQEQVLVKKLLDLSWSEMLKAQGYYNAWQERGRMDDLLNAHAHITGADQLMTGFYWYGESPPHKKRILQQWDSVTKLRSLIRTVLREQIGLQVAVGPGGRVSAPGERGYGPPVPAVQNGRQ